MNPVGIMQGRLSPPVSGRPQAFPWASWTLEFEHASICGFDSIEWLFEAEDYEQNPLWTESGRERIKQIIDVTSVQVPSVCAHYFLQHPFFRVSERERQQSITILNQLIAYAADMGMMTILLPVLEEAEIRTDDEALLLLDSLQEPLSLAMAHGIRLGLETELPATQYRALVEKGDHPALGIYYDTGNATVKGYDIAPDIELLAPFLCGIHIKDRKCGGASTFLGQGHTKFAAFFDMLKQIHYTGGVVLETPVGEDPIRTAKIHREFLRPFLH